jgi:molybdopterin-guanine dinucleotide biosynthesis protein A/rhodanese-related sulfurtransferase
MGTDKAFVEIDAAPMVMKAVTALTQAGATDVQIIGGDRQALEALGLEVITDPEPYAGPLPALATALDHATNDVVVVLSCDLPNAKADAVGMVLDALGAADVAIPTDGEHHQWLHSAWRRSSRTTLRAAYEAGERSISAAIDGLDVHWVTDIDPVHLHDADTPTDLPTGPGAGPYAPYPAAMHIAEIDIAELARLREQGVPVLDVRQPGEYEEAHVPGVVLIPLDQLPDRLAEVPDGELYVICRMGGRSAKAVEFLAAQGVQATNVAGGTMGWIEAGHPVDRGAGSA